MVDGDPLANIADVPKVVSTVRSGILYPSRELFETVGVRYWQSWIVGDRSVENLRFDCILYARSRTPMQHVQSRGLPPGRTVTRRKANPKEPS